ncbi:hypothetical protein [Cellulophaga sp. BC115SP]|uniref:hypothetical protein n=1 Tax=Cellulophaga sp. BC115SP TaxID=2683263 RepID=UPI00141225BC|nr:hypothetical protein [Cellulophaga sp. BC115SP]NBB31529.1 hypothetical protein [Cellulophaga sp. BC115SP]
MKRLCPFIFISMYAESAKESVVIFNVPLLEQENDSPQKVLTPLGKSWQIGTLINTH